MSRFRRLVRSRHFWGLYSVNFVFQRVLRITSRQVSLLHFTNVISADRGFHLTGTGDFAVRCLRVNGGILIQASNEVFLDRSTLIGPGVKIIAGNHDLDDFAAPATPHAPLHIGPRCWIGAGSVILPGVTLGPRTIVGAGSVVTHSFEEGGVVVAGNPARVVRHLSQEVPEST